MTTDIITTNQVYKSENNQYAYFIEIELNDATVIGHKTLATLVPVIPEKAMVELVLKTNQ